MSAWLSLLQAFGLSALEDLHGWDSWCWWWGVPSTKGLHGTEL